MTSRLALALGAALVLSTSGTARADDPPLSTIPTPATPPDEQPAPAPPPPPPVQHQATPMSQRGETIMISDSGSSRGVAEEFLVLPEGGEVGGRLRAITADGGLGPGKLDLTDVALFDLNAQWAIAHHYELDAAISILAKQPSETHESIFQGGSLALRRDLVPRTALALSGSASPLLGMSGMTYGGSLALTHKKRLNEIVTFSLAAGADSIFLHPTGAAAGTETPILVEGAAHAAVLVRVPNGVWGAWLGAGYALPVYHHGRDPVSNMSLDPQPRLDLDIGNAVQLADDWDLSADLVILDRGELANPATRLPILDGGFDQVQIIIGISRRIHSKTHERHHHSCCNWHGDDDPDDVTDPVLQL